MEILSCCHAEIEDSIFVCSYQGLELCKDMIVAYWLDTFYFDMGNTNAAEDASCATMHVQAFVIGAKFKAFHESQTSKWYNVMISKK